MHAITRLMSRSILMLACTVFGAMLLTGCSESYSPNAVTAAQPDADQQETDAQAIDSDGLEFDPQTETLLVFNVSGMTCDGCAMAIENKIRTVAGVRNCLASFEEGEAQVVVSDPEAADSILQAITDLDYEARLRTEHGS